MNWWAEVMGWRGTLELVGLLVVLGAGGAAVWWVGYCDGRLEERRRRWYFRDGRRVRR